MITGLCAATKSLKNVSGDTVRESILAHQDEVDQNDPVSEDNCCKAGGIPLSPAGKAVGNFRAIPLSPAIKYITACLRVNKG